MTFTKTPPTEPVPHYWREHSKAEWKALELFINDIGYLTTNLDDSFQPVEEIGGEWGGRVPAPGTTEVLTHDLQFIAKMLHETVVNQNNKADFHVCEAWEVAKAYYDDPQDGVK